MPMTPRARVNRSGVPKPEANPEKALLNLLGLAMRSGNALTGTDQVRKAVRDGTVAGAILAADASPTQREKLVPLLEVQRVPYHIVLLREQLGGALGKAPVSAVGLTTRGFARRAAELAQALAAVQHRVQE